MQTIIEVDGVNVEPLVVDSIHIFTGQRYSIVLTANQTVDNYWIRAQPADTLDVNGINMAILRYAGAPSAEPNTTSAPTNPMLETNLHPLQNPGAPGKPQRGDVDIALNLKMAYNASTFSYSINGATFIPPTAPVLLQILSGARSAQELLPPGSVYTLPRNKVIEISIPGGASDSPVRDSSPLFVQVAC
jgi:iron transport multicopper oxidase